MNQTANQIKYGKIRVVNFTKEQWNHFWRIMIQKCIQCIIKENLLLLNLWQWSRLEIRLNAFRRSTIPQKQFIIIIFIQVDTIESFRYLGVGICPGGGCELATVARTRAACGEVSWTASSSYIHHNLFRMEWNIRW